MHFEILIEDQSGKRMLERLVPKILNDQHSFRIISYKGIGIVPKHIKNPKDASNRILMDNLPKALRGYGKTWRHSNNENAVIVVCDLDDKKLNEFKSQLQSILEMCNPAPETRFCFAIEEGEAWFLGDFPAIKKAYPRVKESILNAYENDSICGTWETLANAVYSGGAVKLTKYGWQMIGLEKSKWAERITPHMDITSNWSPSFNHFKNKLIELATMS